MTSLNDDPYLSPLGTACYENLGSCGRMLSGSKTAPAGHKVFWNASIYDADCNQVWHGDVDFTRDAQKLEEVAKIGAFYVGKEHPYRFDGLDAKTARKAQKDELDNLVYFKAV